MADYISREATEKLKQSEKIEMFPELQGERYIDRIKFLADIENRYCVNCEKLYEIGEAPCKACGVMDMMEDADAYPAADVRPVAEISNAVDEVLDFLNDNANCMPYHIYSALFDLVSGICPNCGCAMENEK